ncbi:unnamed protein product [Enterobius vermicularis]|uniref:Uncharacterized protein n=1 Tax=Enterobius vermicularis TaxID=51028 RepID=A0A0N4VRK2_ENTVE|nr:unnamed protein product [Enterobius vermicularis]
MDKKLLEYSFKPDDNEKMISNLSLSIYIDSLFYLSVIVGTTMEFVDQSNCIIGTSAGTNAANPTIITSSDQKDTMNFGQKVEDA